MTMTMTVTLSNIIIRFLSVTLAIGRGNDFNDMDKQAIHNAGTNAID